MTTELTPMESFQKKVKDRLIKDIGDLMPDDALKAIVEKATNEAFFEPTNIKVDEGGWNRSSRYEKIGPSFVESAVKGLLEESVDQHVKQWIKDNDQVVADKIDEIVKEGLATLIIHHLNARIGAGLDNVAMNAVNQMHGIVGQ